MADGVGQSATESEQCRQRHQVGIDRPLDTGTGEAEVLWIWGAAMETMVWSMNVIATAKIIAARTRFLDRPPVVGETVMALSSKDLVMTKDLSRKD